MIVILLASVALAVGGVVVVMGLGVIGNVDTDDDAINDVMTVDRKSAVAEQRYTQ